MSHVTTDSRPVLASVGSSSMPVTEKNRNEVFFPLSRRLSGHWETLAQHPKFALVQPSDVERIRRKNSDDVDHQAFEFLMIWYQKYERRDRTVEYLLDALKDAQLNLAAEALEDVRESLVAATDAEKTNASHDPWRPNGAAKRCHSPTTLPSTKRRRDADLSVKTISLDSSSSIPPQLGLFSSFGSLSVQDDSRSELPCYPLDRNPLGFAVVINNQDFSRDTSIEGSKSFDNREGTKKDAERLRWLWERCGFEVKEFVNLTGKEILERLSDLSRHHVLDEHDALVVCILSHGGEGVVYGTDGAPVDMEDVLGLFRPDKSENLAGKPKLFFVQACRGDKLDLGVVADGGRPIERGGASTCTVPSGADFCISYAAEPGHVALRDVVCGTPYVCALCEAMVKHSANRDFHYVLTAMNNRICSYSASDGRKQTPQVVSTLRKLLFLTMK